ncbi:hypothetical protein [Microvirga sp. P5_D2]
MRILAVAVFLVAAIPNAFAADLYQPYPSVVYESDDVVVVRPVRRIIKTRTACVRCSHLPLGGLREPVIAQVPLGGLREACPPVVVRTVREDVVLRVKG